MLLPGSPAIDMGSSVNGLTTDQRGAPRPAIGSDIGAVETTLLTINNFSEFEGASGTTNFVFTVTRSDNLTPVSVIYNADGTASAGSDYTAQSGTINFAANGTLTQTITIAVNGDSDQRTLPSHIRRPADLRHRRQSPIGGGGGPEWRWPPRPARCRRRFRHGIGAARVAVAHHRQSSHRDHSG